MTHSSQGNTTQCAHGNHGDQHYNISLHMFCTECVVTCQSLVARSKLFHFHFTHTKMDFHKRSGLMGTWPSLFHAQFSANYGPIHTSHLCCVEFNSITVRPLLSGHPRDFEKWPLNRGWPRKRGTI